MSQRDNILQELIALKSSLTSVVPENCFAVPSGYFEGLPEQMLSRIKALEAGNAGDELASLSPAISRVPRRLPFEVPDGYFDGLSDKVLAAIQHNKQTVKEELESISPFLSSLKKEMPFSVPSSYFENARQAPAGQQASVVSISSRKWFRYAAAAVVAGIIALAGFVYSNRTASNEARSLARFEKKLSKEIDKTSDKELDDFLQQFSDAGLTGDEKASAVADKEVKELLKDVSETELKEFLRETSEGDISSATEEPSIMN